MSPHYLEEVYAYDNNHDICLEYGNLSVNARRMTGIRRAPPGEYVGTALCFDRPMYGFPVHV